MNCQLLNISIYILDTDIGTVLEPVAVDSHRRLITCLTPVFTRGLYWHKTTQWGGTRPFLMHWLHRTDLWINPDNIQNLSATNKLSNQLCAPGSHTMHYCIVYCTHYTKFWSALSTQCTATLTHLSALSTECSRPKIGTQHSVLLTW